MKTLMISKAAWKEVMDRCAADPNYVLDANCLAQDLETVSTRNAAVGVISSMKAIGLINGQGKLTELGAKWANKNTHSETCRELAETFFPQATRNAILQGTTRVSDIVSEYAEIEGMNEAGGRKNVRVLTMLMEDANLVPSPKQVRPSVDARTEMPTRTPESKSERVFASSKKSERTASSTKAHIEMTVPIEKLSDIILALFCEVSPSEASVNIEFV